MCELRPSRHHDPEDRGRERDLKVLLDLGPAARLRRSPVQAGEFLLAARATLVIVSEGGTRKLAVIHLSFIAGTRGGSPLPGLRSADPVNAVGWTSPQEISTP